MMNWLSSLRTRFLTLTLMVSTLILGATPVMAAGELDSAIENGFGKLVKYGRWGAALVLAVLFVLAWAQRSGNQDNPHEVQRGTSKMIWTGIGFVAVIGYKLILTGLVEWFNVPATAIPSFLWQ